MIHFHDHPNLEKAKGIDFGHVIVDRQSYQNARALIIDYNIAKVNGAGLSSECNTVLCESASSQQTVQNAGSKDVLETEFRSIISHRMLGYDCDMEVDDWEGMLDDLVNYAYKHFDI